MQIYFHRKAGVNGIQYLKICNLNNIQQLLNYNWSYLEAQERESSAVQQAETVA